MEKRGNVLDSLMYSCSICLDLLKDPVTIPCGHNYCMDCIKTCWDDEDHRGVHSCPQCRKTFTPKPVLVRNSMLAELVEDLKKTGLQAAPGDPSKNLQENICSRHDEVMKIFCRTDQQSICYLCTMDEHKGHETVSAAAERCEKQKELEESRQQIQQRIQDREKDVELLQQEVEDINVSADKAVEDSEKSFNEVIRLLQKRSSDVKQQVRSQQEQEVSRVKDLQEKLQQEITDLKRREAEMKQLSDTEDHNQFLHNYPSPSPLSGSTLSSSIQIRPLRYFEDVTAAVSETIEKLQDLLRETWTNISLSVAEVDVLLSEPEPKTRYGFLKYSRNITLDPNTANSYLLLSDGNRKVTRMNEKQSYSDHPDRFTDWLIIIIKASLTGRCYWEVEWRGKEVYVVVVYKNISRKGNSNDSKFGCNNKSWSLRCDTNSYTFWHNNIKTRVSGPRSSRVGVYLDHGAGLLSFYSVYETMTLLHRVQTSFTQPLHAGLSPGGSAELVKVK
ncbi:tripartite motif-containing protein 16-like protein [Cololabis saira]|uniref:tripartite motif-containing protein 16-like protein n=1 Tax=Cololabis saira TaxID=129043 RepID=UPI002AD31951|nr:tripartite motif-containing protein 16-like protein [Cololabis saira]